MLTTDSDRSTAAWFVSGTGHDTSDGKSRGSAFRSIGRALSAAKPGNKIAILPGTYSPFEVSVPDVTLSAQRGAVVTGEAGARDVVLVTASGVVIQGLQIRGCVPNPTPTGGLVHDASAGVRVAGASRVVLADLTVHDSHGLTPGGLPFGCLGIVLQDTTNSTVMNSNVFHNGEGIEVDGGGPGDIIEHNETHDNDVLITNTAYPTDDDWGAVGVGVSDATDVTVTKNTSYDNFGPSHDWGTDGGAVEIYQSSDLAITDNTGYNNDDVLETGASGTANCSNNVFSDNTFSGRTKGSKLQNAAGIVLRCAHDMTIMGNKISNVDWWAFWIYQRRSDGGNGGTIGGLTITRNIVIQRASQVYALGAGATSATISINDNKYTYRGPFARGETGQEMSLSEWKSRTGFDQGSKG